LRRVGEEVEIETVSADVLYKLVEIQ